MRTLQFVVLALAVSTLPVANARTHLRKHARNISARRGPASLPSKLTADELLNPTLPIEAVLEEEASDVEVCQSPTCNLLRQEVLVEAVKCRPIAHFKARRSRIRRALAANSCKLFRQTNFRQSKGKCAAAVKSACERAGVDARLLSLNAFDLQKQGLLEKAGFVNLRWKYDEKSAPLGAILTYVGGVGHHYGHIEVRVNPNLFCSDHCSPHAVTSQSEATRERYKLVGVYLPFTASIQVSALVNSSSLTSPN